MSIMLSRHQGKVKSALCVIMSGVPNALLNAFTPHVEY